MTDQSQRSQAHGCVVGIFSLFCLFAIWFHPVFGVVLWLMGLWFISAMMGPIFPKEPEDTIYVDDWEQPRHVVYQREVKHEIKVTETVYASRPSVRPRQEFDPYRLKGIFRDLN
jgi:hypothetical protein